MPCILLLLVLFFPRVILVLLALFDYPYLSRVYHGLLIPVLGFIFLPLTTLVYAWEVNSHMAIAGMNLLLIVIAVIIDLGGLGGGWRRRGGW